MKVGDRVYWPAGGKHGTIVRIIDGDAYPRPYAWVDFPDDYKDIELKYLRPAFQDLVEGE